MNNISRRCKCGALIGYDNVVPSGIIPSHDISASSYHLEINEWLSNLTKAIDGAWPRRHVTYTEVHVLIIVWEETDMRGMEKEIRRLSSVFSDIFGYNIHRMTIPISKADLKVRREVDNFIEEYGQQDNLLIVYYAGHARPGLRSGSPPIWYPKNPIEGESVASFDTNNILPILARAQDDSPDVLLIYDCCHSLSSHPTNDKPSRAIVECLFAGGFESKVPIAGPDSFTHALYDELCVASKSPIPLSVTDLHRKIIHNLANWKPHGVFNEDDRIRKDKKTKEPVITKPVRITPIHMFLSENEAPRTIFLAPKNEQGSQTPENQQGPSSRGGDAEDVELPRVLLAVRLVEKDYNAEALKSWILTAPHGVVKFERIYRSYSELLIVELPLQVWDLLPRSSAVTFLGFTRGKVPIGLSPIDIDIAPTAIGSLRHPTAEGSGEELNLYAQLLRDSVTDQTPERSQLINAVDLDSHVHHSETKEDGKLVWVLGAVDQVLPKVFIDLEKNQHQNRVQLKILFDHVLEDLIELQASNEIKEISKDDVLPYKDFLFQYMSAKHLVKFSPTWLDVANRLTGPLGRIHDWEWYNEEARADSESIPETTNHSNFWSSPGTDGGSSVITSSLLDSTPDISIGTVSQKGSVNTGNGPVSEMKEEKRGPQTEPSKGEVLGAEANLGNSASRSHITEIADSMVPNSNTGTKIQQSPKKGTDSSRFEHGQDSQDEHAGLSTTTALVTHSRSAEKEPEPEVQRTGVSYSNEASTEAARGEGGSTMPSTELTESGKSLVTDTTAMLGKAVSFDHKLEYILEDSDSESESSVPSGSVSPIASHGLQESNESETDCPTIKSRHADIDDSMETASVRSYAYEPEQVEVIDPRSALDARYQVHKHTDFQLGRVFKVLWSEQAEAKTLSVKGRSNSKFYIGFRRFIIIATEEEGHSTCIPILTYERRGCTKAGVNPKTHGIVYNVSDNSREREPRQLKGEPELGFPPIKVDGYKDDEPLPKESRVNYAKLITIEHNVKVFFIGFVPLKDFEKVIRATNQCWENNMRKGR